MMGDLFAAIAICMAFVIGAVAVVLGSYLLARKMLHGEHEKEPANDAAGQVGGRIALLYGLILALVYAQELSDYKDVRIALSEEGVAIADVFNDIQRYGGTQVVPVQRDLLKYATIVAGEEWDRLGRGEGLSANGWTQWGNAYERVLSLKPQTDRERYLANRMRDRITSVARMRQMRASGIEENFADVFWPPALIGLILLAVPLYVYRPTRSLVVLLSVFGAYAGVILFFIYAFSDPFEKPARVEPVLFQQLRGDFAAALAKTLPTH